DHVRLQFLSQVDGFSSICGFTDYLQVRMSRKNQLQTLAHNGMVISEENLNYAIGHVTSILTPLPTAASSTSVPPHPRARVSIPASPSPGAERSCLISKPWPS